jgi:phosphoglycerate kinase
VGPAAAEAVSKVPPGGCLLLENVRFHAGETACEAGFAKELAALADVFVQDAFGTAHRKHASTDAVPRLLSPNSLAGLLLKAELDALSPEALAEAPQPLSAVVGGKSLKAKTGLLAALLDKHAAKAVFVGGGAALPLLQQLGRITGAFPPGDPEMEKAAEVLRTAEGQGVELVLPTDLLVRSDSNAEALIVELPLKDDDALPPELVAADVGDVGPASIKALESFVGSAGTIVWNAPVGRYEDEAFSPGTAALCKLLAEAGSKGQRTLVAGADSATAVERFAAEGISFVSTGGGAAVELLACKSLPGVESLADAS